MAQLPPPAMEPVQPLAVTTESPVAETEQITRPLSPVWLTLTTCGPLCVATTCAAKLKELGATVIRGPTLAATPLPERPIEIEGALDALLATVRAPARTPATVGLKATCTAQLPPAT